MEQPPLPVVPTLLQEPELPVPADARPRADIPDLTGFVLARPEVERDASRRVLAALRFEGEMHLVRVGDIVGSFRVAQIEARESVTLVGEDGSQTVLRLE